MGYHRTQINIGNGTIVVTKREEHNKAIKSSQAVMVCIVNVDDPYNHVKQTGAQILSKPKDYPYGEKQYSVLDIGGYLWTFSQTLKDVKLEEWGGISVNL